MVELGHVKLDLAVPDRGSRSEYHSEDPFFRFRRKLVTSVTSCPWNHHLGVSKK